MQARALKTFRGRYGIIRAGTVFQCEPGYFAALEKNKLAIASDAKDAPARAPGPGENRNIPEAPRTAGKESPGEQGGKPGDTEPPPDDGRARTSSSLRADLASRAKTLSKSAAGVTSKSVAPAKKKKTRVVSDKAAKGNPPADA